MDNGASVETITIEAERLDVSDDVVLFRSGGSFGSPVVYTVLMSRFIDAEQVSG